MTISVEGIALYVSSLPVSHSIFCDGGSQLSLVNVMRSYFILTKKTSFILVEMLSSAQPVSIVHE